MHLKVTVLLTVMFTCFLVLSCDVSKDKTPSTAAKVVAKAGDIELNLDEFSANFVSTGIIKDSAYNAKKSIEAWATEALFYQEAISKLVTEEIQVDRQVEEYRQTLINYIYQSKLVDANLDTIVTSEEIENYYDEHRDNFILKDNIVKVNYLKVSLNAVGLNKIKKLLWSVNPKDRVQLEELCSQNAENFFLNDSTWLFLEEIKKEIPALKEQPDFSLRTGKVLEFTDEEYYYYLKIKDEKVKNGLSPLAFERNNIKKFVLNNRKTQLVNEYKQLLLEKAKADKRFVMYP